MRAVVIAGGAVRDYAAAAAAVLPDDMIICADSGYLHAVKMGLSPTAVLGDFDSMDQSQVQCENVIVYPAKKDQTDTEICIGYALEHGCDEILMLGATGGRIDHELANVFLLKMILDAGKTGSIYDGVSRMWLLKGELSLAGSPGDILSIIPVTAQAKGITTHGLAYPLDNASLDFGTTLGVSNVFLGPKARVQVKEGLALIVWTKAK